MSPEYRHLRSLDMDDLIVMKSLLNGIPPGKIAKSLGLTPPAISHRQRKYREAFPGFFDIDQKTGIKNLSKLGREISKRAEKALKILSDATPEDRHV